MRLKRSVHMFNWTNYLSMGESGTPIIKEAVTIVFLRASNYIYFSQSPISLCPCQWSAAQKICLVSFMVNLRRSKGHARWRLLLIWSTHLRQSMCPHGRNISTSFPFSVQLPQVIFGFHNWYFMLAMSKSKAVSSPAAASLYYLRCSFYLSKLVDLMASASSVARWFRHSYC